MVTAENHAHRDRCITWCILGLGLAARIDSLGRDAQAFEEGQSHILQRVMCERVAARLAKCGERPAQGRSQAVDAIPYTAGKVYPFLDIVRTAQSPVECVKKVQKQGNQVRIEQGQATRRYAAICRPSTTDKGNRRASTSFLGCAVKLRLWLIGLQRFELVQCKRIGLVQEQHVGNEVQPK